jgi:hypothetical protein
LLRDTLRSIKQEVWADAVEAAIGVLIMVETFPQQLRSLCPL